MHANPTEALPPTIPVRMLNEFTYCPRLFYLEWVQGEFKDNYFTVDGRYHHRRSDKPAGSIPPASEIGEDTLPYNARALDLASSRLGLATKFDVVEGEGTEITPIEYKRGAPPNTPERAYEPERVQLCAQGLLLRDQGYPCTRGYLYFAKSRERVEVPFDDALVTLTLDRLASLRRTAVQGVMPQPLVDSPKCEGCSLNAICLPDETHHLQAATADGELSEVRRLLTSVDDALPLYVQEQGHRVGLKAERLEVRDKDRKKVGGVNLFELSQVVLFGNIQISTQAIRELCDRSIPLLFLSYGGWFYGMAQGNAHKNVELRRAQYRAADNEAACLALAKRIVQAKIGNCRTLLRRNGEPPNERALSELASWEAAIDGAGSLPELLGYEGNAARIYFANFASMLRPGGDEQALATFNFETRTRRPPADPVNALLSLAYAMLTKEWTITLQAVGLDPHLGFYHQPKYGRPALALDMVEEFRPLVADSAVLQAINNGVVKAQDFIQTGVGVNLTPDGRKKFIEVYERRLNQEVTHPVFGYRISYRRVFEVQARLLSRYLVGDVPAFPSFRTR